MKIKLKHSILILICLVMAISTVSCGDDEPDYPTNNDNPGSVTNPNDFIAFTGVPVYSNYYLSETGLYYYTLGISFGGDDLWTNNLKEFAVLVDVPTSYADFSWEKKINYGSTTTLGGKPFFIGDVEYSPRGTIWEGTVFIESKSSPITLNLTTYYKYKNSSTFNKGVTTTHVITGRKYYSPQKNKVHIAG